MQGYQQQPAYQPGTGRGTQLNTGVTQFMNGVYACMAAGVAVTAAVAYGISTSPEALSMFFAANARGGLSLSGLGWVVALAPIALILIFGSRMMTMSRGAATAVFMVLAVCYGVTFSIIPLAYAGVTIFKAFAATMGMFAAMSIFGYVTKKDLSGIGQFLLMALFGVIIASLINAFFVQSHAAHMGIDVLVVLIFAGLTAYDTQKLKQIYLVNGAVGNLAVLGALNLYLDFINIFISLLHLFGGSRE